jgi:hypothetical protein
MNLFTTTLITGIILVLLGYALRFRWEKVEPSLKIFPRSVKAAYVTMGIGGLWFLFHVLQLGFADFGQYKQYIFLGFAALGVMSFKFSPDFLAVRGLSIVLLLSSNTILTSAFRQEPTSRLLLVTLTYVVIILALWLGSHPYKMRDFIEWLSKKSSHPKSLGIGLLSYGLLLTIVAFTY